MILIIIMFLIILEVSLNVALATFKVHSYVGGRLSSITGTVETSKDTAFAKVCAKAKPIIKEGTIKTIKALKTIVSWTRRTLLVGLIGIVVVEILVLILLIASASTFSYLF